MASGTVRYCLLSASCLASTVRPHQCQDAASSACGGNQHCSLLIAVALRGLKDKASLSTYQLGTVCMQNVGDLFSGERVTGGVQDEAWTQHAGLVLCSRIAKPQLTLTRPCEGKVSVLQKLQCRSCCVLQMKCANIVHRSLDWLCATGRSGT